MDEILLLQRNNFDRYEPGKWEFPGGKLEKYQDLYESLIDEVDQETGLKINIETNISFVDGHLNDEDSPYYELPYVVIFFICGNTGDSTVSLSHEHQEFAWVEIEDALDYDLKNEDRNAIEEFLSNKLLL